MMSGHLSNESTNELDIISPVKKNPKGKLSM